MTESQRLKYKKILEQSKNLKQSKNLQESMNCKEMKEKLYTMYIFDPPQTEHRRLIIYRGAYICTALNV